MKYLVRPDDYQIFEVDPENGAYRIYENKPNQNRFNAYEHFTYENLTENYDFFPITEEEIPIYEDKHDYYYKFLGWQCRNDGHGGTKGGTREEYDAHLKRVEEYKKHKKLTNS